MFTATDVKNLREKTGCGMMDCKKALTESDGDMEKALEFLREKGLATAAKKSGRIAAEGIVDAYVDGNVGVLVEVNAETDFVAKNDEFRTFVTGVAKEIAKSNPASVEELLEKPFEGGQSVRDALTEKIAKIGENMNIRRFERYDGIVETYIHGGGRIGVMVEFDTTPEAAATEDFKVLAKDIAMQIAAIFPQYIAPENVPADVVEKEKEILTAQAINEGKPANIAEKMVAGRIKKFYKEVCLVEQPFIKDADKSVSAVIKEVSDKIGAPVSVVKFARLEKGEGLEKREDNFADEVANMIK